MSAAENLPYVTDDDDQVASDWTVTDLGGLDWALEKIAASKRLIAENKRIAELAIQRATLKTDTLNAPLKKRIEFFESHVRAYAEQHRDELLGSGKTKTRKLLHGSIAWRKTGGNLVVQDKEALLEWARLQPIESGVLRITESPDVNAIKALHKVTGEIFAGTELIAESEELIVKVSGDE